MWHPRWICLLLAALLLAALAARPQTSHRRPSYASPSSPNIFDQMEKQKDADLKDKQRRALEERQRRQAERAELARELPRLIELGQQLQAELDSTNLETTLPVNLQQQGAELERLARRIHKRLRNP